MADHSVAAIRKFARLRLKSSDEIVEKRVAYAGFVEAYNLF